MGVVPPSLRSRIALVVLLGAFLIPLGTSSLRGLTHVLSCEEAAEVPFTLLVPERGAPTIISSATIERGDESGLCGGLVLNLGAGPAGDGRIAVQLPITNNTAFNWRGTVQLRLGSVTVPVEIGEIRAGETAVDTIEVNVDPGKVEVEGSLLIGP